MIWIKRELRLRLMAWAQLAVGVPALTAILCAASVGLATLWTATLWSAPAGAADYVWPVTRVIDGDTVEVEVPGLPPELSLLKVRLRNVDTPEKSWRAKCPSEKARGKAATDFTAARIAGARRIVVRNPSWGKYGGRILADLMLDGLSLSQALVAGGYGRPYDGGRRKGWCP